VIWLFPGPNANPRSAEPRAAQMLTTRPLTAALAHARTARLGKTQPCCIQSSGALCAWCPRWLPAPCPKLRRGSCAGPSMQRCRVYCGAAASIRSSTASPLTTHSSTSSAATWSRRSSCGALLNAVAHHMLPGTRGLQERPSMRALSTAPARDILVPNADIRSLPQTVTRAFRLKVR